MIHLTSKHEFYKYSRQNLLGNRLVQYDWQQFQDLFIHNPKDLPEIVGVRHVRKSFTNKGISGLMKRQQAYQYGLDTTDKENLLFDEGAVHDHLTIQGEVCATEHGLYLRYSHLQCHQRTLWHIDQFGIKGLKVYQKPHNLDILTLEQIAGLEAGVVKHAWRLQASAILQKYMDDHSWQFLNELLSGQLGPTNTYGSEFPNFKYPVVEFAAFDIPVGIFGWSTVFWEVRTRE